MPVKNIQYVWNISTLYENSSRSPLFPRNEKNQWYLELSRTENSLSVQLHPNDPDQHFIIQNLNISVDQDVRSSRICASEIKHKKISVSFRAKQEFNYNRLLLENREYSDFTIMVQNTEIPVHKVVLANRSPVFYAMLTNNLLEKNTNSTTIIDFDKETISALIRYIYTFEVDLTSRDIDVKNLLAAADKYDVKDLNLRCENYLVQNLKVSNALNILIFAEDYNFARLREKSLEFLAKNLSRFSDPESLNALDSYPHLYRALISKKMEKPSSVNNTDDSEKKYCYNCGKLEKIGYNCFYCAKCLLIVTRTPVVNQKMYCDICGELEQIVEDCSYCAVCDNR